MKVINLYCGPGGGKSTGAAKLFAHLKQQDKNVELVTEFAKQLTWQNRQVDLSNQIYVFAKQHSKLFHLEDEVDVVVTDSPLLLSLIYRPIVTGKHVDLV